jgi:hypothetical protein
MRRFRGWSKLGFCCFQVGLDFSLVDFVFFGSFDFIWVEDVFLVMKMFTFGLNRNSRISTGDK